MRGCILVLLVAVLVACASTESNSAKRPPDGAEPLNGPEIKTFLAGRTFGFVVYDMPKSLTGTSTWDAERGVVFGEYVWDNQSPRKWERRWFVNGDKNCTQSKEKEAECQTIYTDGDRFFEVTDSGVVHAVSTPVK